MGDLKFIWVIAGTVLAGLVVGFWVSRSIRVDTPAPLPAQEYSPPSSAVEAPTTPLVSETPVPRPNPRWQRLHPVQRPGTLLTNWDEEVESILSSDDDDDVKAKEMLELFPRLPTDGQVEVVDQVSGMLPDKDYGLLAEYTTNSTLPDPVLEALLAGLISRPDAIRLPLLLSIAEDEQHPKNEEAQSALEALLGEESGTNWEQWNATVEQRLRGQPQPESSEMSDTSSEQ